MGKVRKTLKHAAAFDEDRFDELSFGQAHWWLKEDGGEFVRLPKKVRGCDALELTVELEPGSYLLGVGGRDDVRETIEVMDEEVQIETSGGADVTGKRFVFTGDLDCMDRDAAKQLLEGMGARVTGSVSGKTDFLVVGSDPGTSKIEKAEVKGVQQLDEQAFKKLIGLKSTKRVSKGPDVAQVAAKLLGSLSLDEKTEKAVANVSGPKWLEPRGRHGQVLWAIAHGPRGGSYAVHVDMRKKSYGMQCNCSGRRPCKHASALVMLAANDLEAIPEKNPPAGHKEEASQRYDGFWE